MLKIDLLKRTEIVHFCFSLGVTDTFFASNFQIWKTSQGESLFFDVTQNLKTRNKDGNAYLDATDFLEGKWKELEAIQINHPKVIEEVAKIYDPKNIKRISICIECGKKTFQFPIAKIKGDNSQIFIYVRQDFSR